MSVFRFARAKCAIMGQHQRIIRKEGAAMECVVLAPSGSVGRKMQYAMEDQGADWRCHIATQARQAISLLGAAEVLLLLPCEESAALQAAWEARPPLAPPYIFGANAPDGALPPLEALPTLLPALRRRGQLPALSARHLPETAQLAQALLQAMSVPPRLRARAFLPEMLALTVVHPPLLSDLTHGLYPLIAGRYAMTPAGVERSLRLCVESTWSRASLDALERFFGSSVDPERGKPTNREFLCRIQERLTLSMQRLL